MNLKLKFRNSKSKNWLLLLVWTSVAIGLRLTNLAAKPPWTDEFSTLVFSLGNSFQPVPLNRAIALDVLLQPLQPNPDAGAADVIQHLLTESNHPPLYFVLTHWWMQLWQPDATGLVSVWGARSLSALFGAASIPALYGLSWLAFRSRIVSHITAAIMAVSPYGIFLAQEARHYTLAILWVIASLCCLVIATRHIQHRIPLPVWLVAGWIGINALGIATHYFFSLTLCAEAIVLIALKVRHHNFSRDNLSSAPLSWKVLSGGNHISSFPLLRCSSAPTWRQIYIVAIGTIIGSVIWLPVFLHGSSEGKLTEWIQSGDRLGLALLKPIFQALAAWFTMLSLLPVEAEALPVVIVSAVAMAVFFLWALPILYRGFKFQLKQPETRLMTQLFAGVVLGAIALFFFITYAFGIDLTRGARYNFVYFPAVIVLVGASLAVCWHQIQPFPKFLVKRHKFSLPTGKSAVILIWLVGLLSGLTVVCNLGYQKYYRPDLFVQLMQQVSQSPVLIATTYKTHVQIGEIMGIAREIKLSGLPANTQFLFVQDQVPKTATATLQKTLLTLPQPLDLWLVNFYAPAAEVKNCVADLRSLPSVDGYNYQLYHCNKS